MGLLVDGQWHDQWYDTGSTQGRFVRPDSQFRNWITPDGAPGPSGEGGFAAAAGRYSPVHRPRVSVGPSHRHFSLCSKARGVHSGVRGALVHGRAGLDFRRWRRCHPRPDLNAAAYLHQVYTAAQPGYSGRVTIPVLWDKHRRTIVNNESSEIIRMFNSAFDRIGATAGDYYPAALRHDIDVVNHRVYATVNNGVYRAGFATTQDAYDEAVVALFETLDWLEERLRRPDLCMWRALTEADWRLFTTLVRFDAVYHYHFKCNLRRIKDYPALHRLLMDLYGMPGIADTVHMSHIKGHYFGSHRGINPTGIIPRGPEAVP
jgi:putative glutathione S-transferase